MKLELPTRRQRVSPPPEAVAATPPSELEAPASEAQSLPIAALDPILTEAIESQPRVRIQAPAAEPELESQPEPEQRSLPLGWIVAGGLASTLVAALVLRRPVTSTPTAGEVVNYGPEPERVRRIVLE